MPLLALMCLVTTQIFCMRDNTSWPRKSRKIASHTGHSDSLIFMSMLSWPLVQHLSSSVQDQYRKKSPEGSLKVKIRGDSGCGVGWGHFSMIYANTSRSKCHSDARYISQKVVIYSWQRCDHIRDEWCFSWICSDVCLTIGWWNIWMATNVAYLKSFKYDAAFDTIVIQCSYWLDSGVSVKRGDSHWTANVSQNYQPIRSIYQN